MGRVSWPMGRASRDDEEGKWIDAGGRVEDETTVKSYG
jgi:hypothetical protein